MGAFANLSANLNLNIQNFSRNLRRASNQMNAFASSINGQAVSGMQQLNKQTNAWGLNLKSVSRVVSGILISQAFYSILRDVREATNAVWEFTKQLEYAHIAYSNLFGDTSLAVEFINVLKDFAAKTPFSFTEAEKASKRLLAYGIEYKNVMYVMQGVMSAAAIQGDSAKIEAISRAFGQIYTYGKLMTQEVRQLSEAGIPAYEILQEELGLTQEQLRNLGNEAIPASVAINALVDGIQKRFGNVTIAAAKTITGIVSNIKDNATMLFASLIEPFATFIKSALVEVGEFFYMLREIVELKGAGGVFEALFPPEMHAVIRQFIANFQSLGLAITRLVYALGGLLKPVLNALVMLFNAFAPVITLVANVLAELVSIVVNNATAMKYLTAALAAAAAMWVIFKVRALASAIVAAVITGISKALAGLATMLTFVMAHPFWALLIGLGGVLVGISGGFGALSEKVSGFFKQLTQFNGVDPDKVLLPSQKDRANDLDKFNKKLDGTSDAMDDLADSTGKATKAAKGLLSFDEVFKLNEPDEGTGDGIETPDLGDLIDGIGGLGDAYMPEVPDFSEYMKMLTGGFLGKLKEAWDGIRDKIADIASTAIGAAFGGLMGRLLGGKLGGVFGALAGAIVGYFWNKLADYFGLTPDQKVNAGIIGGVGAVIGAILGGLVGGPLGAKLGAVMGGLVGSFWGIFAEALGVTPTQHIATIVGGFTGALTGMVPGMIGAIKSIMTNLIPTYIDDVFVGFSKTVGFSLKNTLIGGLKQGVLGAIVGLGTGILSNAITGWIAQELDLTEQDMENAGVGQMIGNIVGSIAGLILGGPIGSLVGGALGQLAGSIVGEFWSYMSTTLKGTIIGGTAGLPIGALVGTVVGSIGGPLGAGLGAVIGAALGGLIGLIVDKWDAIKSFFVGIGETIAGGFNGLVGGISSFVQNAIGFFSDMFNSMSETFNGVVTFITEKMSWLSDAFSGVATVISDIANGIYTVVSDIAKGLFTVLYDIGYAVFTVTTTVNDTIRNFLDLIFDIIVKVLSDTWQRITERFTAIKDFIGNILGIVTTLVATKFTEIKNFIGNILSIVVTLVVTKFGSIFNTIKDKVTAAYERVSSSFDKIKTRVSTVLNVLYNIVSRIFTLIYNIIKSKIDAIYRGITETFSGAYESVKSKISSMYTTVRDGISNIYTTFTNWISNMWDNVFGKFFSWINDGIDKLREFFGLEAEASSVNIPSSTGITMSGHATGGIFNREHVARFAEGNKAEAVIPLENASAMQPFVDAISNGITATLAPMFAGMSGGSDRQPLYVGTLIADERGLKELERKMEVIRLKEGRR